MRRSNPSQRGFTLLELVVAGVVAAIVLASIGASLSQIAKSRAMAKVRLSSSLRANTAMERIRKELQQAIRSDDMLNTRVLVTSDRTDSPVGDLDRDQILVYTTKILPVRKREYSGEGMEHEVQCRVEEDDAGSALWIRTDAVPDENEHGGGQALPVMDGVIGLNVEAFDGASWFDEWDSDVNGMPWALRVTVSTGGAPDGSDLFEHEHDLMSLRTTVPLDRVPPPYEPPPPEEPMPGDTALSDESAADAAAGGTLPSGGGTTGTGAGGGVAGGGGATNGNGGGRGGTGQRGPGGSGGAGGRGGGSRGPGGRPGSGQGSGRPSLGGQGGGGFGGRPNN